MQTKVRTRLRNLNITKDYIGRGLAPMGKLKSGPESRAIKVGIAIEAFQFARTSRPESLVKSVL
jgi:hypothetical protein